MRMLLLLQLYAAVISERRRKSYDIAYSKEKCPLKCRQNTKGSLKVVFLVLFLRQRSTDLEEERGVGIDKLSRFEVEDRRAGSFLETLCQGSALA